MKENVPPSWEDESYHQYDIVIVGCGAAGIGLLYGLLHPYTTTSSKQQKRRRRPQFSIAVIEQGGGGEEEENEGEEILTNNDDHISIKDPKQWFKASHPLFKRNILNSILYETTPQVALNNRILSIPTGKGLGGGTTINATLITKPKEDDFIHWPDIWKTQVDHSISGFETKQMSRIMAAIHTIEHAMNINGCLCTNENDSDFMNNNSQEAATAGQFFQSIDNQLDASKLKLDSFTHSVRKNVETNVQTTKNRMKRKQLLHYERVNAYEALIIPLLEQNPILHEVVHFYTNSKVERLLVEKRQMSKVSSSCNDSTFIIKGVECSRELNSKTKKEKYHQHSHYFRVLAKQKVILCAGAIVSPALLLVSGIGGNPTEMRNEGIEQLYNQEDPQEDHERYWQWKAIGRNLRDHFIVTKAYFIPPKFWSSMKSINAIRSYTAIDVISVNKKSEQENELQPLTSRVFVKVMDGTSSSLILPYVLASFFRRHCHYQNPNKNIFPRRCQVLFINMYNQISKLVFYILYVTLSVLFQFYPFRWLVSKHTANVLLCLLNPESTGYVTIKRKAGKHCQYSMSKSSSSSSTTSSPSRLSEYDIIVNPGYLTNPNDITRLITSWKMVMDERCLFPSIVSKTKSFCYELLPGFIYKRLLSSSRIDNDYYDYVCRYAKDFGLPYFHFSGSLAMKCENESTTSKSFVVDEMLNVRNVMNLHVCDASIFPTNISGPTALTCLGVGYMFASLLLSQIDEYTNHGNNT